MDKKKRKAMKRCKHCQSYDKDANDCFVRDIDECSEQDIKECEYFAENEEEY